MEAVLDPWRLKLLGDLASLGTVRAVAQAAHLSPSTVSQQLAVLEREAGARLFERAGRRLRLTPAGAALARRARAILDQMDAARAEAAALDDARGPADGTPPGPAGRVTVGAFTSAVNTFVLSAVVLLQRRHPRLRVDVRELDPAESVEALRRGDCDVAVTADRFDGSSPVDPDVVHTPLATDRIVLVTAAPAPHATQPTTPERRATEPAAPDPPASETAAPGQHATEPTARDPHAMEPGAPDLPATEPAAPDSRAPVDLAGYAGHRWSAERPGGWTHDLITRACRRAGFEPDVAAVFASYGPLLAHVEAGLSVTLLPELAVDPRYRVIGRPLRDPLRRRITAAVRSTAAARPSVAAVLAALAETAAATNATTATRKTATGKTDAGKP
ncbi:LysR substrate-binding domain-containing protein [Dactylosporangium sp. CA-139066]|uniref:LysR family transcriptional regulator n=1 Tax=Dactylosporangium sp. CA-139066 TaxID=3239930 RepID=UPI003D8B323C